MRIKMLESAFETWCSDELKTIPDWTRSFTSVYIALCAINGVFALTTTVNNLLVLIAIAKTSALHKPSFILLCLLASSDLSVGCIVLPLYVLKQVLLIWDKYNDSYCTIAVLFFFLSFFFTILSYHAILAISTDRHLAVCLRDKYTLIVTKKRVKIVVVCIVAVTVVHLIVFIPLLGVKAETTANATVAGGMLFYLLIAAFNFARIRRVLKRQRTIIRIHPTVNTSQRFSVERQSSNLNAVGSQRYSRAMQSMIYIFGAVVICYTPLMIVRAVNAVRGSNACIHLALHITTTIVYANSSLNPILYFWRIPEIRRAVRKIIMQWFGGNTIITTTNSHN